MRSSAAMNPKKWALVAALLMMFILVELCFNNSFLRDSLTGEIKKMIISMVLVDRSLPSSSSSSSSNDLVTREQDSRKLVLSPNLTTCHHSLTDEGRPIYCCPPKHESQEPVIDFQFPDSSSPIRIRRPAQHLDQDYIAKYRKALSIMKSLPYDDPRSFLRQADIHCVFCSGAYNQIHSNFLMKIHRSWLFFPWHRMMIYFHERILGSLIGDDTFALPFWNWDNPEGMRIPDMYMDEPFRDSQREISHLTQVADINFDYVERGLGPEDQIEANVAFMYHQMVSGAKKTELFMGCPYKAGEEGFCDGPGTIELAPHNALHTWVGSTENPEREHLGAFYSAAKDPVFYAHHSNIDRLWGVWKGLRENKTEINDPVWLDSYFYFHDEKSRNVRIKIRDVLDMSKLRYTYQQIDNPWLNARPKPSVPPKLARQILKRRENQNEVKMSSRVSPDFGPEGQTLDSTVRVRVPRPKTQRTKKQKKEEEEILVIYGIEMKRDVYVKFDVFVNAIDETTIGPESREFAGTFVNMRSGVRIVMNKDDHVETKKKTTLKLGISELLEDLEAEEDESIWVALVPRGGTCSNTTVQGVRIEYMR